MTRGRFVVVLAAAAACCATRADAACTLNSAAVTPLSASTGTYTPPAATTAQPVSFTITGTYSGDLLFGGTCTLAISWQRASVPASMARTGGGATLPYTIQTLPGGGNTLLFTGGGAPAPANRLQVVVGTVGALQFNVPFTANVTAYFLAQPGSPQREGSYTDGPTVQTYSVSSGGVLTLLANSAFTVTGTVAKACTISGVYTPAADSAMIPVGPTGIVDTTPIGKTYANATCNALTNLQVTSQIGAVKRTAAAPGGFTNFIDYSAAATYGGASSTLNTATTPTATGSEAGTIGATSGSTSSGSISVTITPMSPSENLVPGSYSDTLRVTLTPQ
jgi:hypothetical protein